MSPDAVRTGVCVIRVEREGSTAPRITVTIRRDVHDRGCEKAYRTVSITVALQHVLEFLTELSQAE